MRKILVLSLSALALTACGGGGGKSAIVNACVEEGEDKAMCSCMADALEEGTDEETFALIAKGAKGGDVEASMEELPMDKKMSLAMVMMGAATKCAK